MPLCKVWNDNDYLYEEKFKGDHYVIEPKGFIEMDFDEAHQFLGTFKAMIKRGDGTIDPRSYKKLRIEGGPSPAAVDPLVCHANGQRASTTEELAKMLGQFSHLKAVDAEAEKLAEENKALKARLSSLEEMVQGLVEKKQPKKKADEPHAAEG